jgi:hypothetical protein
VQKPIVWYCVVMFSPDNNTAIAALAVVLVNEWKARNIRNTLGRRARALYDKVDSLTSPRPMPLSPDELETLRRIYVRKGYQPAQALSKAIQDSDKRLREITTWHKEHA